VNDFNSGTFPPINEDSETDFESNLRRSQLTLNKGKRVNLIFFKDVYTWRTDKFESG